MFKCGLPKREGHGWIKTNYNSSSKTPHQLTKVINHVIIHPMPSYRGIFKAGRKSKRLLECFAETQEKADLEFNEYAQNEGLIFIRSYLDTNSDIPEEIKIPTYSAQRKILLMVRHGEKFKTIKDDKVAEYLESNGQLIRTKNGYKLG